MEFPCILLALTVILGGFSLEHAFEIPSYIKICHQSDPNLGQCVKESVHNLRPYLRDGIPMFNIPAMEPLVIGDMNILEGGPNGLNVKVRNLQIYGASNFEIGTLMVSDHARRFDFNLGLPYLQGFGDYEISGKLLYLPLSGNGPFQGNFTNFAAAVTVIFNTQIINGEERTSIKKLAVKITPGDGQIHLDNLFNGNKATGDTVNKVINSNFRTFTNELIEPIQRALEMKFHKIASGIVESFAYADLFPEGRRR